MKTITPSERSDCGGVGRDNVVVTKPEFGPVTPPEFRRDDRTTPGKVSVNRSRPTILVALDFLPASLNAVEHALVWAKQLQASILLLHVLDPIYTSGFANLVTRKRVWQEARRRALEHINKLANSHAHEGVPIICVVRDGLPTIEILQLAAKMHVNMIILGRRPKNLLNRWLMGSVSDDLVDVAACPVVVVNSTAAISNRCRKADNPIVPGQVDAP